MEKPIQLLLNSDGGMLFHARDIWEEKGKKPLWVYYERTSISDESLYKLNMRIKESGSFYCLIRRNVNEEYRHGHIHFKFTIDKIQKNAPNPVDGVPIIDYPRKNPEDNITFYLKVKYADSYEKKCSDYVTENNQEITNSHLRRPLIVVEKDEDVG